MRVILHQNEGQSIFYIEFCEHRLRENIKDASMSDLRDFLENIRKYSPKIGEVAMRHVS